MIIIILIIFGFYNFENSFNEIEEVRSDYLALTNAEASSKSFGLSLLSSKSIYLYPFKLLYLLFSPIPPAIFFKFNLYSIIFSIGSFIKYFYTLLFLFYVTKYFKKIVLSPYNLMNVLFILFILISVLSSSTDSRHINFLFPLIFYYGIKFSELNPLIVKRIKYFSIFLIPLLITVYTALKI